jgi:hypothetical protein
VYDDVRYVYDDVTYVYGVEEDTAVCTRPKWQCPICV